MGVHASFLLKKSRILVALSVNGDRKSNIPRTARGPPPELSLSLYASNPATPWNISGIAFNCVLATQNATAAIPM